MTDLEKCGLNDLVHIAWQYEGRCVAWIRNGPKAYGKTYVEALMNLEHEIYGQRFTSNWILFLEQFRKTVKIVNRGNKYEAYITKKGPSARGDGRIDALLVLDDLIRQAVTDGVLKFVSPEINSQ